MEISERILAALLAISICPVMSGSDRRFSKSWGKCRDFDTSYVRECPVSLEAGWPGEIPPACVRMLSARKIPSFPDSHPYAQLMRSILRDDLAAQPCGQPTKKPLLNQGSGGYLKSKRGFGQRVFWLARGQSLLDEFHVGSFLVSGPTRRLFGCFLQGIQGFVRFAT